MSRLRWVLEKLSDIVVDLIAGIVLYLILGGYISQPLKEVSPYLPNLLVVSLVLTIVIGFLYRFFKSVKFHRFIERTYSDLVDFLKNWDKLYHTFIKVVDSRGQTSTKEFEDTRAGLLYSYPKISTVKVTKYAYVDRILGIYERDYDVIGNLLMKSPFTRMEWFNIDYIRKDFKEQWDVGRTILIRTIGYFDKCRLGLIHQLYWMLHLVPFPKEKGK